MRPVPHRSSELRLQDLPDRALARLQILARAVLGAADSRASTDQLLVVITEIGREVDRRRKTA